MAENPLLSLFNQSIGRFTYLPTTDWNHFFSPEINFNLNPQDAGVEAHVLGKVGSYGSQLSTLIAMLGLLRDDAIPDELPIAEGAVVDEFDTLRARAKQAVADYRAVPPAGLDATPAPAAADPLAPFVALQQMQLAWLRMLLGPLGAGR